MIRSIKKHFIIKLLTKYFLYGYLCIIGILILFISGYFIFSTLDYPKNLFSLIFFFLIIPLFCQLCKIIYSTHYKYRYYKISLYRLKTRGYKDSYFECEMNEPCFRIIIKDILKTNNLVSEYNDLCNKCRGRNLRVERAKEQLLSKVIKEKSINDN